MTLELEDENELLGRWTWEVRRPDDLTRNPHESQEEFGDRAARGESGSGRPCAVSVGGSEEMTINGQKGLISFFIDEDPLCQNSSCHIETQLLPVRTHGQARRHNVEAVRAKQCWVDGNLCVTTAFFHS